MGNVTTVFWGRGPAGEDVFLYTLKNGTGAEAKITSYGGIATSLTVSDRDGKMGDVVLGYDSLDGYLENIDNPYFGALIGRYGNRIGNSRFILNGKTYEVSNNKGGYSLHGGNRGFDKRIWTGYPADGAEASVTLSYLSPDGEEGYPGNLRVNVVYTLTDQDELVIDYTAQTDAATVLNLTNHSYFNLAGAGNGDILGHLIAINAENYTPTDPDSIPTGEIAPVEGGPLDLRIPTVIGAHIDDPFDQLKNAGGYDQNWVLTRTSGNGLALAARVVEPTTGRIMDVETTQPGIQFYTGNFLTGKTVGKGGKAYNRRSGFCLETQHFPDSPNHPNFPDTTLRPGETYRERTVYRFWQSKSPLECSSISSF